MGQFSFFPLHPAFDVEADSIEEASAMVLARSKIRRDKQFKECYPPDGSISIDVSPSHSEEQEIIGYVMFTGEDR